MKNFIALSILMTLSLPALASIEVNGTEKMPNTKVSLKSSFNLIVEFKDTTVHK
jgi:hypothetical protein